jgi:hypothetical protein
MATQPFPLIFEPAIQRDGPELSHKAYTDGVWMRFQRGLPRKMGGYQTLSQSMTGISRGLHSQTLSGQSYIHSGYAGGIELYTIDQNGNTSVPANRTPGGFTSNANNIWQITSYYDINSSTQQVLAFVIPGLADIAYGATTGNLYAGPIYTTAALTSVSGLATDATGGVLVIPPYTLVYGSNGLVQWSVANKPLDFVDAGSGAARVTDQKIVKAMPLRGGGGFSPSALLWSIDSVIRMYFVGGAPVFSFDILTDNSSILSYQSVVEVEGVFFWIGQDRFLTYNGVLQEVANPRNINFFFDNLNRKYSQKAFAVRNTRWGEIWFCAPLFGATECNWAVIYNHRENTWYDTPLPNSGRSAAVFNEISSAGLLMTGVDLYNNTTYRLWQHEVGTDQIDGATTSAINSSFTTGVISPTTFQQPLDKTLHLDSLEPDFIQAGDMTVNILTRANSKRPYTTVSSQTISASPPTTAAGEFSTIVPTRASARQMKLQFVSNAQGGNYQAGRNVLYVDVDTARRL